MRSRPRRAADVALVVVAALLLAAAAVSGYARAELADERAFADRAASALDEQDVRTVLAERIVDGLTRSVAPQALVVRPLVVPAVAVVAGTSPFRRLMTGVLVRRHEALAQGERSFVLSLAPGGRLVREALRSVSPRVAAAIPPGVRAPVVALDARDLELRIARVLGDVARWWWPLLAAAVLACGACALLAGGVREALGRLGLAAAGAGLLVAVAVTGFGSFVVAHAARAADLEDDVERGALDALWGALFGDLRTAGLLAAVGGVVVATLAFGGLARRRVDDAGAWLESVVRSPRPAAARARAAGLVALGVALVLQPGPAVRVLVVVAGGLLVLVGITRLAGRATPAEPARAPRRAGPAPLVLAGAVAATVAVTATAVALVLPAPRAASDDADAPTGGCNGSQALCERRLNEVVFPATHNSYAAADQPGWFFASQRHGIARQLRDGIRALLVDVHLAVRDPRTGRERTDLAGEGSSRNKVTRELSPQAVRTADRLAGRVGLGGLVGARRPFLCHTLCELGAEPLDEQLRIIERFLAARPGEVIVLFVEPYVPVATLERAFAQAGLLRHAAELRRDEPLPTLGDLVRSDRRLVVLAEQDGGARPWYLDGFSFTQDTPLGATRRTELSCRRARGNADSPLFLVNHWIPPFPPSVRRNEQIGGRVLQRRLEQCGRRRGLVPNLVAVDFYERTDVVRVAARLNER